MSTIVATVCLALQAFSCQPTQIRVVDGDTVHIQQEKIRILGIDAPELKGACPKESQKALEAKQRLSQILNGSNIIIKRENRDKYGRTLATLTVENVDVGDILMREGLARKWEKKWRPGLNDIWCPN